MTTVTVSVVKTATCTISYSAIRDRVSVTSPSGKVLAIDNVSFMSDNGADDWALLDAIMSGDSPRTQGMTYDEMKHFARLAERAGQSEGEPSAAPPSVPTPAPTIAQTVPAVQVPAPIPAAPAIVWTQPEALEPTEPPADDADEAPAVPQCLYHGPMIRMVSDRGWKCSQSGRFDSATRRFRDCNHCFFDGETPPTQETINPPVITADTEQPADTQPQPQPIVRRRRRSGRGVDPLSVIDIGPEAFAMAEARLAKLPDAWVRVEYDIPKVEGQSYAVPDWMRARGAVQSSESVYFIHAKRLRACPRLLALLYQIASRIQVWQFHPDEVQQAQQRAAEVADDFVRKTHTALIEGLDKAAKQCDEAIAGLTDDARTHGNVTRAEGQRDSKRRAYLKEAQKHLEWAIKAAMDFDVTDNVDTLVRALQDAIMSYKTAKWATPKRRDMVTHCAPGCEG